MRQRNTVNHNVPVELTYVWLIPLDREPGRVLTDHMSKDLILRIISSSLEDGLSIWLGFHSPPWAYSSLIFLAHLTSSTWRFDFEVGLHAKSTH